MQDAENIAMSNKWVRSGAKRHKNWNCCCYCFTTQMGVYIIAAGQVLLLLEEYSAPNFLRGMLKLAMVATFGLMFIVDSALNR